MSPFRELAFKAALALSEQGKPSPPLRATPAEVWDTFFAYASLLLGGSSLIVSLPELIALTVIKARSGWDGCAAVELTILCGVSVAMGMLSFCVLGSSKCAVALQWSLGAAEAALAMVMIGVGTSVLASDGIESCYTAAISTVCGFLALVEGVPSLGFWTALLAIRCYRDTPELPLVNLYSLLPSPTVERMLRVPLSMRAATLFEVAEADAGGGSSSGKVEPSEREERMEEGGGVPLVPAV